MKQCNDKTWKATYFRSGAHSLQVNENKSIQSREYSDWKMLAGGSSE